MSELRQVREFNNDRLCWGVVGERGGIHMWCNSNLSYGGIEVHSKTRVYEGQKPSNEDCWLIGCKCFHDGSSLWWSETGCYLVARCLTFHKDDEIWRELWSWYEAKFPSEKAAT